MKSVRILSLMALACALLLMSGCGYYYTVERGDTLYSISQEYGVTVDQLKEANGISDPRKLQAGQQIKIPRGGGAKPTVRTAQKSNNKSSNQTAKKTNDQAIHSSVEKIRQKKAAGIAPATRPDMEFIWPAKGAVVQAYGKGSDGRINDGIKIGAPEGSLVVASADGEVIMSSDKFPAYGNMVVIKHKNKYVTLYCHNRRNLVKKGDKVHQGQPIAEVGKTGRIQTPALHFEIRMGSTPVDPQKYLPAY